MGSEFSLGTSDQGAQVLVQDLVPRLFIIVAALQVLFQVLELELLLLICSLGRSWLTASLEPLVPLSKELEVFIKMVPVTASWGSSLLAVELDVFQELDKFSVWVLASCLCLTSNPLITRKPLRRLCPLGLSSRWLHRRVDLVVNLIRIRIRSILPCHRHDEAASEALRRVLDSCSVSGCIPNFHMGLVPRVGT
jgi:hypothetical protein